MLKKHTKKGFSLIELIVAISIMAVLASVLIPSFIYQQNKSRMAKDEIKFESICAAFKQALAEPEVRNEIDVIAGGGKIQIVCEIAKDGVINFEDSEVIGTSNAILGKTKLWLNSFQSIGTTYTVEYSDFKEQYLVFAIIPKTSSTTAKCEYKVVEQRPE